MRICRPAALRLVRTAALAALAATAAAAEVTTQDDVVQAELLPGWQLQSGAQMAALKLDLAPGWKTYWRSPGDAGIPPQFDWSDSINVKSVRLHWPAPSVFRTNGMQTIGYHDQLVLPAEIVARDPSKPMVLSARIDLGVCRDICMPAALTLEAAITPPGTPDSDIRAALAARPDTPAEAGLVAIGCTVEPIADGLRLTATLELPWAGRSETVAFETADPAVWVAEAVSQRQGDRLVAVTDLVPPSGGPFALDRSGITVTVIRDDGAVEIAGCPAAP
ncbi:hypothetical protein LHP98_13640 [Rhodobacter sp. Har01]|uniref:protein-disulfide reductase DsbD domain-containing protein n=1 Tax=Rhodobacter sp. Har01 TaxID=2883999 RepID=UPI001D08A95F|nr:protein-disulfide reductase DsbD domain-containing protein [Rhodobacter sp. Har01]MCB6179163.1 hypothetical protein [Rhodobacter sp. Har01]